MMPRTINKLRAKLPGGKIGAYSITTAFGPGLSLMLLDDIGVIRDKRAGNTTLARMSYARGGVL
jgi:hypothetical protein